VRNKNTNIKTTPFPLPRLSFSPSFPTPLTAALRVAGRMGSVGYGQYRVVSLCCSFLLTYFPFSKGPLHRLQSFSKKPVPVRALHRLQFLQEYPSALAWSSPWAAGDSLVPWVFPLLFLTLFFPSSSACPVFFALS